MRICLIGPGIMPIPPTGWGGVEVLMWNYKLELEKQGHEVLICNDYFGNNLENKSILDNSIKKINDWKPDFTHLHYDCYADMMPMIESHRAMTSHYPYIDIPEKRRGYEWIFNKFCQNHSYIFTLSEKNNQHFSHFGARQNLLWKWIYGVDASKFVFSEIPTKPDRTLCLGKIEPRKQQTLLQGLNMNVDFVGPLADSSFNPTQDYLGSWSRDEVCNNVTNYANMILLSDGESAPQVTLEALLSGCGLVVSEEASANLDRTLPFIDVVDRYTTTTNQLREIVATNREKSIQHRKDILEYGKSNFELSKCVLDYTKKIESIIE